MTEPTTPTGQLTVEHFDAALPINAGPNRILAIEQEAAAAERAQMTPYLEAALDDADRLADALRICLPALEDSGVTQNALREVLRLHDEVTPAVEMTTPVPTSKLRSPL